MFNSLMPSLNIRSLPFVVFMGGFPSRLQNLSSGAIRPGGLLLTVSVAIFVGIKMAAGVFTAGHFEFKYLKSTKYFLHNRAPVS